MASGVIKKAILLNNTAGKQGIMGTSSGATMTLAEDSFVIGMVNYGGSGTQYVAANVNGTTEWISYPTPPANAIGMGFYAKGTVITAKGNHSYAAAIPLKNLFNI